jgi:apolipoprotein N-acyltransferase
VLRHRLGAANVFSVLLSAALYTLSFPPWDVSALVWISLVPLFAVLVRLRPAPAFLAGLVWGTAMIWGVGHWVPAALSTYWAQPAWFGFLCSLLGSVIFVGLYAAGFGWSVALVAQAYSGARRCALIAMLWVAWEVGRGRLLTGDPWLLIGYGVAAWPTWIQIADLGGIYLVSLVIAHANATVAEVAFARQRSISGSATAVALLAFILLATYGYGSIRLESGLSETPITSVAVIQGNNDLGSQWRSEYYGQGLQDYLRLSEHALAQGPVDLLVWPESAVTFFLAREPAYANLITSFLGKAGADLIVGAPHYEDADPAQPKYYNSAFYVTGDGGTRGRYDKVHLLPFGEYFPLRTIGLLRRRFERVRTFTPGQGAQLLDTDFGKVAVVICFEAIFPELVRERMSAGAVLLVNLSNDAWLGGAAGAEQHLAMARVRAIENRTWLVRATTTGASAVIDPHGRIRERGAIGEEQTLLARVVTKSGATPYQLWGDIVPFFCVIAAALLIGVAMGRKLLQGRRFS